MSRLEVIHSLRLFVVAVLGLLPEVVAAFPVMDPCTTIGTVTFTPWQPGPNDPLGIKVFVAEVLRPSRAYELIRVTNAGPAQFDVDVVFADSSEGFPDYTATRPLDNVHAYVGPLQAGSYTFNTTVRVLSPPRAINPVCDAAAYAPVNVTTLTVLPLSAIPSAAPETQFALPLVSVVEYYNTKLDHYFMTADKAEMADLDSGVHAGWLRTGQSFLGYAPVDTPVGGVGPAPLLGTGSWVKRYYGAPSAGLDSHFFTMDMYEEAAMESATNPLSSAWLVETNNAFQVYQALSGSGDCPPRSTPVYRLWNGRKDSNHRDTTSLAIRADMLARGWIPEGYGPTAVVFCAPMR